MQNCGACPKTSTKPFLQLRLRELRKREQENCKSQRIIEFAVRLCFLTFYEAFLLKACSNYSLITNWAVTTRTHLLTWKGVIQGTSTFHKELQTIKKCCEWAKHSFSEMITATGYPYVSTHICFHINIYTYIHNVIHIEQVAFGNIWIDTYVCNNS